MIKKMSFKMLSRIKIMSKKGILNLELKRFSNKNFNLLSALKELLYDTYNRFLTDKNSGSTAINYGKPINDDQ